MTENATFCVLATGQSKHKKKMNKQCFFSIFTGIRLKKLSFLYNSAIKFIPLILCLYVKLYIHVNMELIKFIIPKPERIMHLTFSLSFIGKHIFQAGWRNSYKKWKIYSCPKIKSIHLRLDLLFQSLKILDFYLFRQTPPGHQKPVIYPRKRLFSI